MTIFKEFREFIARGNVVDLAVGVIIGASFGKIVTSLVDQVCIDIPPARYDEECAFWAEATGWELRAGSRPEFRFLVRPEAMPLRILLQRLDRPAILIKRGRNPLGTAVITENRVGNDAANNLGGLPPAPSVEIAFAAPRW